MLIGSRQSLTRLPNAPTVSMDGAPLKQVLHSKYLGVYIDQNLSWSEHIQKVIKKIASGIGALKRVRSFVPIAIQRLIFNSLIQPHFDYCFVVWDKCKKTLTDKLQKLQNRAARILTYSPYDASADPLIESLGWKKLENQRKVKKAVMVYKSLNSLAPSYMRSMFIDRDGLTNYSLRDTEGKLAIPKPRTNYLKNSFSYDGAILWNSLPIELRQAKSLNLFKTGCSGFFK